MAYDPNAKTRLRELRTRLYEIRHTPEAQVLQEFLETKLEHLGQQVLQCSNDQLQKYQGQASLCISMLKDLTESSPVDHDAS